jgi:hypothetical protein
MQEIQQHFLEHTRQHARDSTTFPRTHTPACKGFNNISSNTTRLVADRAPYNKSTPDSISNRIERNLPKMAVIIKGVWPCMSTFSNENPFLWNNRTSSVTTSQKANLHMSVTKSKPALIKVPT